MSREITVVTLDLMPGCKWQRAGSETVHTRVKVIWQGEPKAGNEITRGELASLMADRAEVLNELRTAKGAMP